MAKKRKGKKIKDNNLLSCININFIFIHDEC